MRQIAPHISASDRIVDVGAGTCNVSELLADQGFSVTPVDVEDLSFVDGLRPQLYDGARLPFDDDEFDVALLLAVLHHTEDPQAVLAETARVARRLVVMEDVHSGRLQKHATYAIDSLLNLEFGGHPHNNKSDAEWRALFQDLGLSVQDATYERWLAITSATYHLDSLPEEPGERHCGDRRSLATPRRVACRQFVSGLAARTQKRLVRCYACVRTLFLSRSVVARSFRILLVPALGAAVAVLLMNAMVVSGGGRSTVRGVAEAPSMPVVIVLGARVHEDGRLYPTTNDRVDTAVELYKAGKARKILVSGDHGQTDYDEVNSMRKHVLSQGVPAQDVFMDHAGFDTYDTMYRARDIFGVKKALVVTQKFHVARAVYTARGLGIVAVGVPADKQLYYKAPLFEMREALARANAFVELALIRPKPKYLGAAIDISGDGRVTNDQQD